MPSLAPVGTIFINLIRMTVIPLVASMLVASVGSLASSGALGRAGARAALVAVVMLRDHRHGDGADRDAGARANPDRSGRGAGAARSGDGAGRGRSRRGSPTLAQWFVDLVSPNVVKAAADGAMLPVIVFAVLFGVALAGVAPSAATPCCG